MNTVLKAEVLFSGKGCPVCGGEKTEKAKTCKKCLQKIGPEATGAVNAVLESSCDSLLGNAAANSGNVARGNVWGTPVLANLRIDRDAVFHPASGDILAYWECRRFVPGRFISVFIFGLNEDARGQEVCGLVELKIKQAKSGVVHYLRVQVVSGVRSDVKLATLGLNDQVKLADAELGLPSHYLGEGKKSSAIGFLPMKNGRREEDQKIAASV